MRSQLRKVVRMVGQQAEIEEYVAVERVGERAELRGAGGSVTRRRVQRSELDLAVFRDVGGGRGSARLRVAPGELTPERLAHLAEQTMASLEPPWQLSPPAAPARVAVADPALAADLSTVVDILAERVEAYAARAVAGGQLAIRGLDLAVAYQRVAVRTSRGLAHHHDETSVRVHATLAGPDAAAEVRLRGRRLADMDIEDALVRAAEQLRDRRRARPTPPARYDLVVAASAVAAPASALMGRELGAVIDAAVLRFGWLAPLVAQADARLVRHGLARYRPGRPVYERAGRAALTLVSDGAIPFGLLSSPIGDLGEPVRRFALVERGVAAGLALDMREAGILGVTPNGGARNLRLGAGAVPAADLVAADGAPVLEAVDIDALEVDVMSGAFTAMLGLGYLGAGREPVTGGVLRGNLFELWAGAQMAAETTVVGWYHGPRAIRCGNVELS